MKSFDLTVTETHLEKFVEATKKELYATSTNCCPIAQALSEKFGKKMRMSVTYTNVNGEHYMCEKATILTNTIQGFGKDMLKNVEKVRPLLPLTFKFTLVTS